MKNKYEIRGDITAIFLRSPKHGDKETIIDTSDLPKVLELFSGTWYPDYGRISKYFYACGHNWIDGKLKKVSLHRLIMDAKPSLVIDHINHDTLDNRRSSNLREVTTAQNGQNRKGAASNNTHSGIRGVYKDKTKWKASISVNKKYIYLGNFDDVESARLAVETARRELMPYSKEEAM